MNAVTKINQPTIDLKTPTLSQPLHAALLNARKSVYQGRDKNEPNHTLPGRPPSKSDQVAAQLVLDQMQAVPLMRDVDMQNFLTIINVGVAGKDRLTRDDIPYVAHLYASACDHLPATTFGPEATKRGLREWKWFPSAAEVAALGQDIASDWLATRQSLRDLVAMPSREEVEQTTADQETRMSDQDRAIMADRFNALKAELETNIAVRRERPASTGKPLDPSHLAAIRAADPRIQAALASQSKKLE